MSSIACEVMVGFVVDKDLLERYVGDKVIKKDDSSLVLAIDITIYPNEQNGIGVNFCEFFNTDL